jgi:hypothetical protein
LIILIEEDVFSQISISNKNDKGEMIHCISTDKIKLHKINGFYQNDKKVEIKFE